MSYRGVSCVMGALSISGLLPLLVVMGCDQAKSKVEQRAEEMASVKSAEVASAKASSSVVDPKELQYAAVRKQLRERAMSMMTTFQNVYKDGKPEDQATYRDYYLPTPESKKEADELSKEAGFAGKMGMAIATFEIFEVQVNADLKSGSTSIQEDQSQRGKPRCIRYTLDWKEDGGALKRGARRDVKIVDCGGPPPPK